MDRPDWQRFSYAAFAEDPDPVIEIAHRDGGVYLDVDGSDRTLALIPKNVYDARAEAIEAVHTILASGEIEDELVLGRMQRFLDAMSTQQDQAPEGAAGREFIEPRRE